MQVSSLDADILRTIHTSEDTSVYDKIVNSIFDEELLRTKDFHNSGRLKLVGDDAASLLLAEVDTRNRDLVSEVAAGVFRQHCAKHLEITPMRMRMLGDYPQVNRST